MRILPIVGLITFALLLIIAVRLFSMKQQLSLFPVYWQKRASVSKPNDALTYIALGDSAAVGIGASSPEKGYVGLVADSLGQKYQQPVHITNISVSGAKLRDVIDVQLPQLAKLQIPADAIITLDVGSNDLSSYQKEVFAAEINTLLSQLPKQTVVADIPYFGGGRMRNLEGRALEASQLILESAQKHGLRLAQLHKATTEHDNWRVYAADLFHPTNYGYRNWHNAFWQVLESDKVQ